MRIYLDHNATSPLREEVVETMIRVMREYPGNTSSVHEEGRAARAEMDRAREHVAVLLGVSPEDLREEWGAVALPGDTDAEEVAEQAAQWANTLDAGEREDGDIRKEIEGSLAQLPLADLLQLFHLNRRTGTFEMVRKAADGRSDRDGHCEVQDHR